MYVDEPAAGFGFVALNIVTMLILVALPIVFYRRLAGNAGLVALVVIACAGGVVLIGLVMHAIFDTVYTIDEEVLGVRCGVLLKGEYRLDDIHDIGRVSFNNQAFGSALHLKGYCTRFTDGVTFHAAGEKVYLSPKDPGRFIAELERRR